MFPIETAQDGSVAGLPIAWCQIYLPGSGWVEFDPTNGIVGNRDLIRVAVARNPDQAIPLSGVYYGDRDDELGMDVEVNVKSDAALSSTKAQEVAEANKMIPGPPR
jgi:transglutaminase-like putative cysteine protease